MTGEPKTLTLEEALVLTARDTQYSLVAMPDEDSDEPVAVSWVLLGAFDDFGPFTSWVQAAEYALGVRVVARDEAAELRAALAKMSDLVFTMLSAEDELSRAKGPGGSYPEDVAGYHAARRNAWEELCSLAREHDDPDALRAALAASEEES